MNPPEQHPVLVMSDVNDTGVQKLLGRYGLTVEVVPPGQSIEGSFWGDEEAGLIGNRLLARDDTPVHSVLHEACHYVCMDEQRRLGLHTNAGGDYDEENAVCFLQILLAGYLADMGQERILIDMDLWGYSFRLGSARRWFEEDAEDARSWLLDELIIDKNNIPTWKLRGPGQ